MLQTVVPFYLIVNAESTNDILSASGIFLFGFTYLYVGITNLTGFKALGLGWYCLWVAVLATLYGMTNFTKLDDPKLGLLWLHWAVLWGLFWAILALAATSSRRSRAG